jgi:peptidoglycan/LPS O-acetylase OafA/YrhL
MIVAAARIITGRRQQYQHSRRWRLTSLRADHPQRTGRQVKIVQLNDGELTVPAISSAPRKRGVELPELNGLRGLAVLIVFASHASLFFFGGKLTGNGGGQLGVMLFFMLSGFLMAFLYLDKPAVRRTQFIFAVSRLARIYPLYATVVIVSYVGCHYGTSLPTYQITTFTDMLKHLVFMHGTGALHTIGPEIIFYALFMLLWKLRFTSQRWFVITIVLMTAASWLPVDVIPSSNSLAGLQNSLPFFLVGMLIAMQYKRITAEVARKPFPAMLFWCTFVLFMATLPQTLKLWVDVPKNLLPEPYSLPWNYPFYLLITAALFVTTLIRPPRFMTGRFMGYLGEISFGFYLLHGLILDGMHTWVPAKPWLAIAMSFAATLLLAGVLRIVLESPARKFLRGLVVH